MTMTVWGIVRDGRVVPSSPLPEGAHVQIRIADAPGDLAPNLQAEFDAWGHASDRALDLVERLAQEGQADEWDRRFEADVEGGHLDWLVDEARQDVREGRCTDR